MLTYGRDGSYRCSGSLEDFHDSRHDACLCGKVDVDMEDNERDFIIEENQRRRMGIEDGKRKSWKWEETML